VVGAEALSDHVLVLNRSWLAIHVVTVRRAFGLLLRDLAEAIDTDDGSYTGYDFTSWVELSEARRDFLSDDGEDYIRTVRHHIRAPKIVRLLFYDRIPKRQVKLNRRNIYARDGNRCQYCGRRYPTSELSIDHVLPKSRGGLTTWDNVVCCCTDCNVKKGGRTPRETGARLVRKPAKPRRSPLVTVKLRRDKYQSWRQFLANAYWSVELTD
jgi:5-methylcytosine-specific restriction endonuclease McrA